MLWHCVETDKGDKSVINFVYLEKIVSAIINKINSLKKNTYKKTINLPQWMLKILRPIFEDLLQRRVIETMFTRQNTECK